MSCASLMAEVRACTICRDHLPFEPRPVFQMHPDARLLIVGQAPGKKAHDSGLPFDDVSGDRLRDWLGITRKVFYDPKRIALLPMGFCFPGTGRTGDLPPRPECAATWRAPLLAQLNQLETTLVMGQYAHAYHFAGKKQSLAERVKAWRDYWPRLVPMPHPSPRNIMWLRRNPWFEAELIPALRERVAAILSVPAQRQ